MIKKHFFYGLIFALFFSSCRNKTKTDTLFTSLSPQNTGISFRNTLIPSEKFNIIQYLYYYNGGGTAAGDVNNDGLPDLYFTSNQAPNKLYLNEGNFKFKDITESAEVAGHYGEKAWNTGVSMIDVNGDGWLDIYVCEVGRYKHINGRNRLYINDGTPEVHFTERAAEYGLDFVGFGQQAVWLDYDADGDADVYLLNHSVHSAENYAPSKVRYKRSGLTGDRLLRNDGGTFTDVSKEAGIFGSKIGFGLGAAVSDLNGDGCPDIYVANDFHENDYIYYNNCDGTFREDIEGSAGHTGTFAMGTDIADLNNDGLPDLMTLDMKPADETVLKSSVGNDPYNIYEYKIRYGYHYQYSRNMLQLNRGATADSTATFSEIGQFAGVDATDWSWSTLLADFDLDGQKDIFITNGIARRPNDLDYLKYISDKAIQKNADDLALTQQMPTGETENKAFRGAADLVFADVSADWGLNFKGSSQGAAYADFDGDGDLDLAVNNLNAPAGIYRNNAAENGANFIKIILPKDKTLGAKIKVRTANGEQVQEIYPVRGWQSASTTEAVFGLGKDSLVQEIIVDFGQGDLRKKKNLSAGKTVTFTGEEERYFPQEKNAETIFTLRENAFSTYTHRAAKSGDFNREKLIPHQISEAGLAVAKADTDGDGREDIFLDGDFWLQDVQGNFTRKKFFDLQGRITTISDAVFFDADADGDADLYLAIGGASDKISSPRYQDLLFFNDGKGNFTEQNLPDLKTNAACVTVGDFDSDGDADLFIGGRSVPGSYGISPLSYWLENDGTGNFTKNLMPDAGKIGMVTDAIFVSQTQELVVVGTWMPVRIFSFENNKITERKIERYGWWNTVAAADLDGDNQPELLLGNAGKNLDLRASESEPVELYIKDFDNNGTTDPILTYYKQGRKYTYAGKDELVQQMTVLKKKYPEYRDFARADFAEIFADFGVDKMQPLRVTGFASLVCDLDGNCREMPAEVQYSAVSAFTVADFDADGKTDILTAGNFYANTPALGRSDADFGNFLRGNGEGNFTVTDSGFRVFGEVKRMLHLPAQKQVVVFRRGDAGVVFGY